MGLREQVLSLAFEPCSAGVFCQSAIDSAQNDHANVVQSMLANKEAMMGFPTGQCDMFLVAPKEPHGQEPFSREAHIEKIRALFSQLGADKTGVITYAMFEEPWRGSCKAFDQGGHPNKCGH